MLLDVTVRDGGYVVDHRWTAVEAGAVVRAVHAAGVDLVEVGYLRSGPADPAAPLGELPAGPSGARGRAGPWSSLVVMVRPGEVDRTA